MTSRPRLRSGTYPVLPRRPMSVGEIAAATGLTCAQVRDALERGERKLRRSGLARRLAAEWAEGGRLEMVWPESGGW